MDNVYDKRLKPLLKWPGGKSRELKNIHPELPKTINNFYEPFIGGGAVYFSLDVDKYFINDKSTELIDLYQMVKSQDKLFYETISELSNTWDFITSYVNDNCDDVIDLYNSFNSKHDVETFLKSFSGFDLEYATNGLFNKMNRMKKLEIKHGSLSYKDLCDNLECGLKGGYYTYIRYLYNLGNMDTATQSAIYLFIRNYAYSGMFRYNSNNEFNVPYGGISYNSKKLSTIVPYYKSDKLLNHLNNTTINCEDFLDFFNINKPKSGDFIFLDPPYDSEFSTYDKNVFDRDDQQRLADFLINVDANWMMVIKNTDFIFELYNNHGLNISSFNKKYSVSFKNRNDKNVKHLIITNYI